MSLALARSALLFPIEKLLNAMLAGDSHAAEALARFQGKRVEAQTPRAGLGILFDAGGVRLSALDAQALGERADVSVHGTAAQLLRLLADEGRPLADREIRIEGDAELLLDLRRALTRLDVRWEDFLGPLVGDVLTGGMLGAASDARELARDAGGRIKRRMEDFLQYEAGVAPSPLEMDLFAARVDELRLRLDRLQARTDILLRDCQESSTQQPEQIPPVSDR